MSKEYEVPDELLARCVGRKELVQRVLNAFIQQLEDDIPQLKTDLLSGNYEGVAKTAHRIKGASANVAAEPLRRSAERIEDVARNGQDDRVNTVLNQLQEDWSQFVELTAEFLA